MSSEGARRFELWIGLRNILVHAYAKIDSERLFEALKEVEELGTIIEEAERFIEERSLDPKPRRMDEVLNEVRRILEKKSYVVFVYVFGSRIRGVSTSRSDTDVAIYTEGKITWRDFIGLLNELEDGTDMKVDLVHLNTAPPLLAYEVVSTGTTITDRDRVKRVDYEVKVAKEFPDLKPMLENFYKTLLKTHRNSQ